MERTGVIIVDATRRVALVTPVAEELLGWQPSAVTGAPCASVLDCRDRDGESLCGRCGLHVALEHQVMVSAGVIDVAGADGARHPMQVGFWYLPPEGRIYEPRVMAVLQAACPLEPAHPIG